MIILGMLWFGHAFTSQQNSMRREFDRITVMLRDLEDKVDDLEDKVEKIAKSEPRP